MIFQGGVFVDASFTTLGRNGYTFDQLDDKMKKNIENVLNDEFCSLDVQAKGQGNPCMIQNLEFGVRKE